MTASSVFARLSLVFAVLLFLIIKEVVAQSSSPSSTSSTSLMLSTGNTTVTSLSVSGSQTITLKSVVPTTYGLSSSTTTTSSAAASSSAAAAIVLNTVIDPGFGVLGALLILTGIPSAFWGHKNRWTSFFLIGFYTFSLVCLVLILKFGVLAAINPPSKALRGLFVLSCVVAGAAGGAIAIFFWKATRYFIGGWGGLAFGFFIQCFKDGGLIPTIGYRWIMYIGCAVVGFCLCTVPKIHYHVLLISTAFVGATSFMLGIDCFTTAGLKEFYMWNLGFSALFPKYVNNGIKFPVNQTMQIELGLMGAISLMGIAVQLRILKILVRKLREIEEEQKKRHQDAEANASERIDNLESEKVEWEQRHNRNRSDFSGLDLARVSTPGTPLPGYPFTERPFTPEHRRHQSKESNLTLGNTRNQSPGAIPVLEFGNDIQSDVPRDYLTEVAILDRQEPVPIIDPDPLKSRESLLTEIQNIRRSIDVLKTEQSSSTPYSRSNGPSMASRRTTLSQNLGDSIAQYRANSQSDSHSHERENSGSSIPRPRSAPLHEDWDSYVQDRKLIQPPSGVTAPIQTTPFPANRHLSMSSAVLDAVAQRQQREEYFTVGHITRISDPPVAVESLQSDPDMPNPVHARTKSTGTLPVTILPPKRIVSPTPRRSSQPRVATYEELTERHRQKIRELQAPVTEAENQQASLATAKERWERSIAREREAVTKRQAEKAAALLKEDKDVKSASLDIPSRRRRSRTLSADKLGEIGGHSSKRMSVMKVEDWQRHQHEEEPSTGYNRQSRAMSRADTSGVPFPDAGRRRDSGRMSTLSRDPPR